MLVSRTEISINIHHELAEICQTFNACCEFITDWISEQETVGEESITDWLLYSASRTSQRVRYIKFNRTEESRDKGADWEWWIRFDTFDWGARVQAKRLKTPRENIKSINYKPKKNDFQLLTLITDANKRRLAPIYAFYGAKGYGQTYCPINSLSGGVFVSSAEQIKKNWFGTKKPLNSATLLSHSVPLTCLFCCPLVGSDFRVLLRDIFNLTDDHQGVFKTAPSYVQTINRISVPDSTSYNRLSNPMDGIPDDIKAIFVIDMRSSPQL